MIGRREVLRVLATAGATGLVGVSPRSVGAEPPPETTTIRLTDEPYICIAPQYLAEELLRAEGFTKIEYVRVGDGTGTQLLAAGRVDLLLEFAGVWIVRLDAGDPVVVLAGIHVGCFELFATDRVRGIRDLRGKAVAVLAEGAAEHVFLSSMAAYVGVDPRRDIRWVTKPPEESMRLLAEGKVDAFLAFPPEPQELRARKVGHVVVNTATDRPWSQYFCCVAGANREWARRHPVAAKRALRAILKAADLCALQPERAAKSIVDKGYAPRYEYALQTMRDVLYNRWREYDPETTLRFYALRLQEVGMIKASPQKILAQGTDWRFLNELKKELKG